MLKKYSFSFAGCLLAIFGAFGEVGPQISGAALPVPVHADVVVYGGTPSGVIAAVAAARHGRTVALVDLNDHVGGMMSGGLCSSDMGDRKSVGGMSLEFFDRVVKYYTDKYGATSPQVTHCDKGAKFEPSVAEKIFNDMIGEQSPRITVYKHCRYKAATSDAAGHVTSLVTDSLDDQTVRTFTGDVFIDASYEGDLMAGVHVPYTVGRESRDQYGEAIAGVSVGPDKGKGDNLVMAYNYRLSIGTDPENVLPFPKPEHYDKTYWSKLYGPRIRSGKLAHFSEIWPDFPHTLGPNDKFDWNADDLPGGSNGYADGNWATRDQIAATDRDYILSKTYYLQNDPEMTPAWRAEAAKWGVPKDEFTDSGGFPFQFYIREGRRMIGAYVLTLRDLTQDRYKTDGVCAGSYPTDCHVVRWLMVDGKRQEDHTLHIILNDYDIPYRSLTPKDHPDNLLVSVCVSASHVAYCSVRMEPVYMMMGQAAGDAACLALTGKTAVQKIDVSKLREFLRQENALLDLGYLPPVRISFSPGHPKPGEKVHFHADTGELKDPIKQMWWDFEGTGTVGAQGADADYAFSLEKTYSVGLVVEDAAGRRRMVEAAVPVGAASALDVTVDDLDAAMTGRWDPGNPVLPGHPAERYSDVFLGPSSSFDMVVRGQKQPAAGRFQPTLSRAGRYLVCFGYRPNPHQASSVPVTISCDGTVTNQNLNEKVKDSPFPFVSLGEFHCPAGQNSFVDLTNEGTDGRIAVDAVRWVWEGD